MPDFSKRRRRKTKKLSVQNVFEDNLDSPESAAPVAGPSSSTLPVTVRQSTSREPKRKALLVGVSDAAWDDDEVPPGVLRSHEDVKTMMSLLTDDLGFRPEDVCIMMDTDDIAENRRPTKRNILKRLRRMISNAIAGDSFFFYFSGHGFQEKCESGTESDGYDEYIQCTDMAIKDNELHDAIVKPLPSGTQFVALFDSCHAGTMLDLPHYSCNTVVTVGLVFIAIGRMQHRVVIASNAANLSPPPSRSFSPVRKQSGSFRCRHTTRRTSTIMSLSPSTTIPPSIPGPSRSKPTATSSAAVIGTPAHTTTSTRARSASVVQVKITIPPSTSKTTPTSPLVASPVTTATVPVLLRSRGNSISSRTRSSSNTRKSGSEKCDGMCDPPDPEHVKGPRVISLGASADNELSYEKDQKGGLMTTYFVEIMKEKKKPAFRDLMLELRQRFAQEYRERRRLVQQHEDALIKSKQAGLLPDLENLKSMQRPQLSSLHPLNLHELFVL